MNLARKIKKLFISDKRGIALVEFMLVAPIFLIIIIGIIEWGFYIFDMNTAVRATYETSVKISEEGPDYWSKPGSESLYTYNRVTAPLRKMSSVPTLPKVEWYGSNRELVMVTLEYEHPLYTTKFITQAGGANLPIRQIAISLNETAIVKE